MNHKKQLVAHIAQQLKSYGYTVYLSGSADYGFFTDGARVVCFGSCSNFSVNFSGCYWSQRSGTGWGLVDGRERCSVTAEQAQAFIAELPPRWATRDEQVQLETPAEHLRRYSSSKYVIFED